MTPVTSGTVYMSAWLLLAEEPEPLAGYLVFFEMRQPGSSYGAVQLSGYRGDGVGMRGPESSFQRTADGTLPRGTWVCAELFVFIDPVEGVAWGQIGDQRISLTGLDTTATEGYGDFYLGLGTDSGAHLAFFDNFFLGTGPVGCL
jgi:hypothetical protein